MTDYLCGSLAWSTVWFAIGIALGYALRSMKGISVTTPERLRARQRRESIGIVVIAFGLVASTIYFAGEDSAQDECLSSFIDNQTQRSALRADLVERESQATRSVITGALAAENRKQVRAARVRYEKTLKRIDKAREENPIVPFPEDLCN